MKGNNAAPDPIGRLRAAARPGSVLGLERLTELLRLLGDPHKQLKYVHVAGSNGKGSVCAMLAEILSRAGYRTGLYTSPELHRLNERYRINGECISDGALLALEERVCRAAETMEDPPTEFELTTAIMFLYFLEERCGIVVLEVGLGGRGDATNVIPTPEAAVIASIALEHTDRLGKTLEEIAGAKAGIIKENGVAVTCPGPPEVEAVFEKACRETGSRWVPADPEKLLIRHSNLEGQCFDWGSLQGLELPLAGSYQLGNASLVLETVEQLRRRGWSIPDEAIRSGLAHVRWPARMELLRREPLFLLDGAHNPQCMEMLTDNLRRLLPGERFVFLVGVMADKEYEVMGRMLLPLSAGFVCVTPDNPRALPGEKLARCLRGMGAGAESAPTVEDGVRAALAMAGQGPLVACGSLYMAGAVEDEALRLGLKGKGNG